MIELKLMNRRIFASCFLFFIALAACLYAERVGNFEITVQPVTKEKSDAIDRDWQHKNKTQTMYYSVRGVLKGLEKMEKISIKYIVASKASDEKTKYTEGKYEVGPMEPLAKFEFNTTDLENDYQEYWSNSSYQSKYGKAKLLGMTLKIMNGEMVVAEYATSQDAKKYWDKATTK
jgi:hypothetical protein